MNVYIYFVIIIAILFDGCTNTTQIEPTTNLQKETQNLKPVDKKLVYRTIQNEINLYNKMGDDNYEEGHNYAAIVAYEKVNFYEGYYAIPRSKLDKIKKTAKETAIHCYKQLKTYKKALKRKKLYTLNKIIMNDPNYKDSKKLYEKIMQDREIKIFLNNLRNTLHMKLINNHNTTKNLIDINKAYSNLIKYDYKNHLAKEAKEVLKKEYQPLLNDAKTSYNKGNLNTAKKKFTIITTIYKNDKTAKNYLLKIKTKQSIKSDIKTAKKALHQHNYIKALKFSNKIIKIEPSNKEAKTIRLKAKNGCNAKISKLIHAGIKNYELKNLDEAQKDFKEVLKLDPSNNTSLIYTKKIQRQLQTIKSLKY